MRAHYDEKKEELEVLEIRLKGLRVKLSEI